MNAQLSDVVFSTHISNTFFPLSTVSSTKQLDSVTSQISPTNSFSQPYSFLTPLTNFSRGVFSLLQLNINSITPNIYDVSLLLDTRSYDLLIFNESKLDATIPNSFFKHINYISIRNDRNRNGGGTIVFINNKHQVLNIRTISDTCNIEFIAFTIKYNNKHLNFICAYKPPIYNDRLFIDNLDNLLHLYNLNDPIFIIGDLNMNLSSADNHIINTNFLDFLTSNQLVNYVTKPTRSISDSLIDVILHNSNLILNTLVSDCPFSDHKFVTANLSLASSTNILASFSTTTSRCLTETKLDLISKATNTINFYKLGSIVDVDHRWLTLKASLTSIVNQYAPRKPIKAISNNHYPWMDELRVAKASRDNTKQAHQDNSSASRQTKLHDNQSLLHSTPERQDDSIFQG